MTVSFELKILNTAAKLDCDLRPATDVSCSPINDLIEPNPREALIRINIETATDPTLNIHSWKKMIS